MLRFFIGFAVVLSLSVGLSAQETQPAKPGIEAVIGAQLDAFRANDVNGAFEFAAPNIRQMFGTSENFGTMVQRGYPMVWRPGQVQFLELREIANALWQRVEIVDGAGVVHRLDYRMNLVDGAWRISAVQVLPQPDVSV